VIVAHCTSPRGSLHNLQISSLEEGFCTCPESRLQFLGAGTYLPTSNGKCLVSSRRNVYLISPSSFPLRRLSGRNRGENQEVHMCYRDCPHATAVFGYSLLLEPQART
ncbi:hypothetical protein RSAG8_02937, partial [Rhizoctonia solani AG-8 WAC10335]